MKKSLLIALTISGMAAFGGCFYDNEEDLYGTPDCNLDNATFSGSVKPLIESQCFPCHTAATQDFGVVLEGYGNVKIWADNGKFVGAIRHQSGIFPMPKNKSQLPECDIQKIEKWVADGAPNN